MGPSLFFLLALSVPLGLTAQMSGTITGVILNENLQPVPHDRVRLADNPVGPMNTEITYGSDDAGRFVIPNVKWGSYTLQGMKVDDGYPDTFLLFYRYHVAQPTVTLSPDEPLADVVVPIGPKAGRILPVVTDAATGAAIDSSEITLYMSGSVPLSASFPGDSKNILAPASIVFSIGVHAKGYADWYYPGVATRGAAGNVNLKPSEQLNFNVRLQALPRH
jgi:hypothetical protein